MHHNATKKTGERKAYPVFNGLRELGVSDGELTDILATSYAKIEAWRCGAEAMPPHLVAFLTEFLDNVVDEGGTKASILGAVTGRLDMAQRMRLIRAQDGLAQQRAFNRAFPCAVRDRGRRLFDEWRQRKVANRRAEFADPPLRIAQCHDR